MGLNIERILELADHIEKVEAKRFNMARWIGTLGDTTPHLPTLVEVRHDCNTVACIGGWTDLLFAKSQSQPWVNLPGNSAEMLLGLTEDEANALFCPPNYSRSNNPYTQAEAVWTLRNLAETGEVKWRV